MEQDWYELIGTWGSLNYSVFFCICFKFSMVTKLKDKHVSVLFHIPSPCLFCCVVSLNSQGCCFYHLFSKQIFLSSLCWHYAGKEEAICYQKFNLFGRPQTCAQNSSNTQGRAALGIGWIPQAAGCLGLRSPSPTPTGLHLHHVLCFLDVEVLFGTRV